MMNAAVQQKQIRDYVRQCQVQLQEALELHPDGVLLERVNWPLIVSQMAQLTTDVGKENAALLMDQIVQAIRAGRLFDHDSTLLTPFDEIGYR